MSTEVQPSTNMIRSSNILDMKRKVADLRANETWASLVGGRPEIQKALFNVL